MSREVRPLLNRILIKPCPPDEVSAGGIFLPESIRERSCRAKVVAVGNGTKNKPMRYRPTYTVWHIKDSGNDAELLIDGEKHYIIPDSDVLAYTEN
jgi:chaperonin GroES